MAAGSSGKIVFSVLGRKRACEGATIEVTGELYCMFNVPNAIIIGTSEQGGK